MKNLDKKQLVLLAIVAVIALIFFYFKFRSSCLASLDCGTSYCLKTREEAAGACATKLMIIYAVPIVLGANLASMGMMFIWNKIMKNKPR